MVAVIAAANTDLWRVVRTMDGDHHILAGAVDLIGWIGCINSGLICDVDPVAEADLFSRCQVLRERVVDADGPVDISSIGSSINTSSRDLEA